MRVISIETGHYYHVYNRGVDRRSTFHSDFDRRTFLKGLTRALSWRGERLAALAAYVLMPNHFHLLLRQCVDGGIAKCMQRLGSGYTQSFNRRHSRSGSLFEGTYKATVVTSTAHLAYISKYIHRKPIGLCDVLADYQWSSYPHYLGVTANPIIDACDVLSLFDGPIDYSDYVCG